MYHYLVTKRSMVLAFFLAAPLLRLLGIHSAQESRVLAKLIDKTNRRTRGTGNAWVALLSTGCG